MIRLQQARAITLRSQGLAEDPAPFGLGKSGALEAIRQLGYVQMDTISVVQRAHHHVLWSRVPDYQPEMLDQLQSPDAAVYEYWNHASSFLPMDDFRYSLPLMRKHRGELHWARDTVELRAAMRRLLGKIRKEGAMSISDVQSSTKVPEWTEGSWGKIERRALHELWMRGDIMIRSRKGVVKVFDSRDRVLPGGVHLKCPTERETALFHVRRSLKALGIARAAELHYLQSGDASSAARVALATLVKKREVIECRIVEFPDKPVFAFPESLDLDVAISGERVRFLSPFDNAVIQRKRLKWLFGFDYTVEIYVPAAKRIHGYFVLPILCGDRLIGRMDVKAFRAERRLEVLNLVFEEWFSEQKSIPCGFTTALDDFARFQGCDTWRINRVCPEGMRGMLVATEGPVRAQG